MHAPCYSRVLQAVHYVQSQILFLLFPSVWEVHLHWKEHLHGCTHGFPRLGFLTDRGLVLHSHKRQKHERENRNRERERERGRERKKKVKETDRQTNCQGNWTPQQPPFQTHHVLSKTQKDTQFPSPSPSEGSQHTLHCTHASCAHTTTPEHTCQQSC